MKKKILIYLLMLVSVFFFIACEKEEVCEHEYTNPSCINSSHCIKCGEVRDDALDHEYILKSEKDSTCIEAGYKIYNCERCNKEFKVDLEKIDHNYALKERKESSCVEEGYFLYECSVCKETVKIDLALQNHSYIDVDDHKECEYCHEAINQEECDHNYGDATCSESAVCSKCGHIREEALGHTYSLIQEVASTDKDYGYFKFECTRCGDILVINKKLDNKIKNLIIIIGDGMGYEHVSGAMLAFNKSYTFIDWPTVSVNTDSLNSEYKYPYNTTDSAAGGTAIATGVITINGYVGKDGDGNDVPTILDYAKSKGMRTGIITTDVIYGATPADFSAHSISRNNSEEIIKSELTSGVDLIIGNASGTSSTVVKANKTNHQYYNSWNNYKTVYGIGAPVIGVFGIENGDNTPSLADVVEKSINLLSNDKGFVLMIEQAYIDKYCHNNDFEGMINRVDSLGETVDRILERHSNDTAIIITADHETGGLSVSKDYPLAKTYNNMYYFFTTTGHTNNDICLYYYNIKFNFSTLPYYRRNDLIKNSDTYTVCKSVIDRM